MKKAQNIKSAPHLLNIPPEIRNIIYTYLNLNIQITETVECKLRASSTRTITTTTDDKHAYIEQTIIRHSTPAISQVCTQLRSEIMSFPRKHCHLTLSRQWPSHLFTPSTSWINYAMITHIQMRQDDIAEKAVPNVLQRYCRNLRTVIVDLDVEWRPSAGCRDEFPSAARTLRRRRALVLSKMNMRMDSSSALKTRMWTRTELGVYWREMEDVLCEYGKRLYFVRRDLLVLALDLTRAFELELRYWRVLTADGNGNGNGLAERKVARALNWDTGVVKSLALL